MSAYVVSDKTIDLIVSYAVSSMTNIQLNNRTISLDNLKNQQYIAQFLLNENVRSVNHRYKETEQERIIKPKISFIDSDQLSAVVKCCDCLKYQSCETDDYKSSEAYNVLMTIRDSAIIKLLKKNGYDNAPWGL